MTTLKVPEMHCEKCVQRIEKALNEEKLAFKVSLENKTVTIDGCEHCVKTAVDTLDDLGFSAEKI
jgi:copper chaperone CopZ